MTYRFQYLVVAVLLALLTIGCRRPFYRQQADADAYCLIDHKAVCVDAEPGSYSIDPDPRSRMYDPHDPDCEPMPPDDPVSHKLMHCVDCKKGSKCWKCLPRTPFVENPGWLEHLPYDEDGRVVLDLRGSVELALLESPRYQSQLEELYLSALDVSFERFRFDTQFFGGSSVFVTADGMDRTGTGLPSTEFEVAPFRTAGPARTGNRLRATKFSATGGELVVGLANSLMWQFAGPDDFSTNTVLDFSLVQPLLRSAGRTRVLERLTIAERSLLGNVRQMERFRRNFYVSVVTGRDPGQGPSRRGGVFGGSGLEGFSGVGGGGFGRVGFFGQGGQGFFGQGGAGGGFTGGAGAQSAGGYLGLLQTAQVLRNQRNNVMALRDSVEQLQASYEAGRIDRFQVDLARQALYNAQSQLLTSETFYQASLDNLKTSIGLPPELDVKIEDSLLDPFNLLDPSLEALRQQVADRLDELRELRESRTAVADAPQAAEELVLPNLPAGAADQIDGPLQKSLMPMVAEIGEILSTAEKRIEAVQEDFRILENALPQRRAYLQRLADRDELREASIDPKLFDLEQFDVQIAKRQEDFSAIQQRMETTMAELAQRTKRPPAGDDSLRALITSLTAFSNLLLELSLVQASARLETVSFSPVELTDAEALAIAAVHRRDWKNARANLVDTWRLIYFNANDLRSDLDLVFSGDIGNVGDNPLDLRGSRGRLRAGLEFDAPLTRLAERNVYRQSLIEYQQARRAYYQFRDQLHQGLRNTLRQIQLDEINFELRRAAVQVAISQVDLTQLRLSEPPRPGATEQFNNTTARDLVQSLSDLLNVQNDFLSVWVNYEVQRLQLESDLGIMELTAGGLRLENNLPLEMYLENLPYNSCDLGLAAEAFEACRAGELLIVPEGELPAEPLPAPTDKETENHSTENVQVDKRVQLVAAYSELLEDEPEESPTEPERQALPLPLPPVVR